MAQVDSNIKWFLLDNNHADYHLVISDLQALASGHGESYTNEAGFWSGTRVARSYMTAAEKAASSPTLTIGAGAVMDLVDYTPCINPKAGPERLYRDPNNDTFSLWGDFLEEPQALPTEGIDRLVTHWKTGNENVLYVAQTARGNGTGNSYPHAKALKDILGVNSGADAVHNPTGYTIMMFCGTMGIFKDDPTISYAGHRVFMRTGNSAVRTALISHPVDTGIIMGGYKLGNGHTPGGDLTARFFEDADWTFDGGYGGTTYYLNHGYDVLSMQNNYFVLSTATGSVRSLKKVYSVNDCKGQDFSWYQSSNGRTYVNDGVGNPKQTTYFSGGIGIAMYYTSFFDLYGLHLYQAALSGSINYYASDWRLIACRMLYGGAGRLFASYGEIVNIDTGQFVQSGTTYSHRTPDVQNNRALLGCHFGYVGEGLYDVIDNHSYVPSNTIVRDCYFEAIGYTGEGVNIASDDSHSIASYGGFKGAILRNNRFHKTGNKNLVIYPPDNGFYNRYTTLTDSTITNGTFTTDLTGWTVRGTVTQSGGKAAFNSGELEQAITVNAPYLNATRKHVVKFWLTANGSSINVSVGTTSGGTQLVANTTVYSNPDTGVAALAFTPNVSPVYLRFSTTSTVSLDNVSLLTNLANEEGYRLGYPESGSYATAASGNTFFYCMVPIQNVEISYNYMTDPITNAENPGIGVGEGAIAITGDVTYGYGGQIANVKICNNRIDGKFDVAFRNKTQLPSPYDHTQIEIANNVIRNALTGFYQYSNWTDETGNTVEGTSWFHHNDVWAERYYIADTNDSNPTRRRTIIDNNIYRISQHAYWAQGSGTETKSFPAWRAYAGVNDVYDLASEIRILPAEQQYDTNIRYFLLSNIHSEYSAVRANLVTAWGLYSLDSFEEVNGRYTNTKVAKTYMNAAQKATYLPNMVLGANGILDEFNFKFAKNQFYAEPTVNEEGVVHWGPFLKEPEPIHGAYDAEMKRLCHAMGSTTNNVLYVGVANVLTGSGNSYIHRTSWLSLMDGNYRHPSYHVSPLNSRDYDLIVFCGFIDKFIGDFAGNFNITAASIQLKSGNANNRSAWLSHPVHQAQIVTMPKAGNGYVQGATSEDSDWTSDGGGAWHMNSEWFNYPTHTNYVMYKRANGMVEPLFYIGECTPGSTLVLGKVKNTVDSWGWDTSRANIWVRTTDGGNPKNNVYIGNQPQFAFQVTGSQQGDAPITFYDAVGIEFYGLALSIGSGAQYTSDWRFLSCNLKYCNYGLPSVSHFGINDWNGMYMQRNSERTVFISIDPWLCNNRVIQGSGFYHGWTVIYDGCSGDNMSQGVIFKDNFFNRVIGQPGGKNYGIHTYAPSDAHQIAVYGGSNNWHIINNRFDDSGSQNITPYSQGARPINAHTTLTNAVFNNGEFTSNFNGWTDLSWGGGNAVWETGNVKLTANGGVARIEQRVEIASQYVGTDANGNGLRQVVRIKYANTYFPWYTGASDHIGNTLCHITVGTASNTHNLFNSYIGANSVVATQDGYAAFWFVPNTTVFYVGLEHPYGAPWKLSKYIERI
jgi:hypothetical protein